jgi:hypothetical protein
MEQKESKVRLRIQEMPKMQNSVDEENNCDVNDNIEEKVDFTEDVGENTDERKVVRNYETEGNLSTLKPCHLQHSRDQQLPDKNQLSKLHHLPLHGHSLIAPQETRVLVPHDPEGEPSQQTLDALEKKLDQLMAANAKLLDGVSDCELIFTAWEITALGLDWNIHEEIAKYVKNNLDLLIDVF